MTESKYIIFEDAGGLTLPVVFSPLIQHKDIKLNGFKPVSAGFCNVRYLNDIEEFHCQVWGESISLKLKSRREDYYILNKEIERDI